MSMNQMGGWMQNQGTGGQDPASRWLQQQGQMRPAPQPGMGQVQPRPMPMPHPGAMQPMHPGVAAQMPHPAMAQQGWNQGAAQGAIHPAMQHALDQQAHLQSQLGAMRVPPQPMGQSPWGRR
jgi:hypothetical protein